MKIKPLHLLALMLNSSSVISMEAPSAFNPLEALAQASIQKSIPDNQTIILNRLDNDQYQLFSKIIIPPDMGDLFRNGQILPLSSMATPFTPSIVQECIEQATKQICELFSINYPPNSEKIELTAIEANLRYLFIMDQLSLAKIENKQLVENTKGYLYNLLSNQMRSCGKLDRNKFHEILSLPSSSVFINKINKRVQDLKFNINSKGGQANLFKDIATINHSQGRASAYKFILETFKKALSTTITTDLVPSSPAPVPSSPYGWLPPSSPTPVPPSPYGWLPPSPYAPSSGSAYSVMPSISLSDRTGHQAAQSSMRESNSSASSSTIVTDSNVNISPADSSALSCANEEASSPTVITTGKRQREKEDNEASRDKHSYKTRKIDLSLVETPEDCKNEILNCLEEALSRCEGIEETERKLRDFQDYLHSSVSTKSMKTIYHYYIQAKNWGLSNDFFYFILNNSESNEGDHKEAESIQLSDDFIQYLQLREQREQLFKNKSEQVSYFENFKKLIDQAPLAGFNSQPLGQILALQQEEASNRLKETNQKLAVLSRKNGYPRAF
ncbi:hypothetical protein [Candidatus Odyssella thessalonicensis]|uniref:hypothetical protein n=1 Tax=Candidatus Odyssella thessalonicensis TaxID=84647 RepID=UPI000225A91D|nr:hypothetical protein [Candidatus Odyssella thessalonicensis]